MKVTGRKPRMTESDMRKIREWKTFPKLCAELGISYGWGKTLRAGYEHKHMRERRAHG
jgi:hypothetical protein